MAALTLQNIGAAAGTAITFAAATVTVGDTIQLVDDSAKLLVNNASAGSINVTLTSYTTVQGLAVANRVVAVPANTIKAIPLYKGLNGNPASNSVATAVCSAVTTVTLAAITS